MPTCRVCYEEYYNDEYCFDEYEYDDFDSEGVCSECSYLGLEEKVYCQSSDCYQKVKKSEKYCSDCQLENEKVYCKNPPCHEKIDEKLCSNCKNDKDVVRLTSCAACYVNYRYGDSFAKCRDHGNFCLSCNDRIPIDDKYCSEHSSSCLSCSTIISVNQTYCSVHQGEQENLKSLVRQRTSLSNPQTVIRFDTWWNNNLAIVINGNYSYTLWVLVYEPKQWNKEIPENLSAIKYDCDYSDLSSARDKAVEIRNELKYSRNPILSVHPRIYCHYSFSNVVTSPYVKDNQVGTCTKTADIPLIYVSYSSSRPSDLDRYFKPLDIVWAQCVNRWIGSEFYHVGVYLGNDTIFHFSGGNDAVERTDWKGFLKDTTFNGITGKIIRYHPVIPFKNYKDIIGQAVWTKDSGFRSGDYNLPNRNCEHYANMLVYGINFSQQVCERGDEIRNGLYGQVAAGATIATGSVFLGVSAALAPFTFGTSLAVGGLLTVAGAGGVILTGNAIEGNDVFNNNKGSICLKDEIRETENKLGEKSDSETERYERWYLQEVPSKEYCRVM
jgi:hypothetical protein